MMSALSISCCFVESPSTKVVSVTHEVLENGVECTTTVYEYPSTTRPSTRNGSLTRDYSYRGVTVASVVLYGSYTYNGISATANSASSAHSVASAWSYSNESVWCDGASAHLTATVSGAVTFTVSLSLTCSPSGVLS